MGGKACYKRVYKELGDLMGQVYGMNLVDEKKYVGYTERGVIRIIEHLKCYNPYSLGKRQCAFFIPARICKSGKNKGKKIYGRRCWQKCHRKSEFCRSHNSPKYRKMHEKWKEENNLSGPVDYDESGSIYSGFNSAKWVDLYRPTNWETALIEVRNDCTIEDEDRLTLEYMRDFGIENVRGGRWANPNLRPQQIVEIEQLIEDL